MRKLILTTAILSLSGCNWLDALFGGPTPPPDIDPVEILDEDVEPDDDEIEEDEAAPPAPAPAPVDDEEGYEKVDTGVE